MSIRQGNNVDEMTYWQVTGLKEGETTDPIDVYIDTPVLNGRFKSSISDKAKIWARRKGVGASYQDIGVSGIALGSLPAGATAFEVYAEALTPIVGFHRVPISVMTASGLNAGWKT